MIPAMQSLFSQVIDSPYFAQVVLVLWATQQLKSLIISLLLEYFTVSLEINSNEPCHKDVVSYISQTALIDNWSTLQLQTDNAIPSKQFRIVPGSGRTWVQAVGLWIQCTKGESEESSRETLVLRCPGRSPRPINNFIEKAQEFYRGTHNDKLRLYIAEKGTFVAQYPRNYVWGAPILRPKRDINTVFLGGHVDKSAILVDISRFLSSKTQERYHKQGVPYRRGYLFYGVTRTGKSSLARAITGYFNLSLYTISLNDLSLDDGLFGKIMAAVPPKSVLLLEDIDAIGKKRSTTTETLGDSDGNVQKGVSMSGILNAIDGMYSPEGCLVILTTNHRCKLDAALIEPGRVDYEVEFANANEFQAKSIFKNMFPDNPGKELEALAETFAKETMSRKRTPADIQNYLQRHDSPEEACNTTLQANKAWFRGNREESTILDSACKENLGTVASTAANEALDLNKGEDITSA